MWDQQASQKKGTASSRRGFWQLAQLVAQIAWRNVLNSLAIFTGRLARFLETPDGEVTTSTRLSAMAARCAVVASLLVMI